MKKEDTSFDDNWDDDIEASVQLAKNQKNFKTISAGGFGLKKHDEEFEEVWE